LTREAADVLVEKYRILRQDDASGTGRNSYRITVRQLESMIRLSEAIARANCTSEVRLIRNLQLSIPMIFQITPAFVREAYSLLRQSIIHVEQDDIDFDEEELRGERDGDHQQKTQATESQDVEMSGDIVDSEQTYHTDDPNSQLSPSVSRAPSMAPEAAAAPPPPPKRRMVITHDKYMTLQSLIVMHLSQVERETGKGLDRDELIDWYLELKEEEMQDLEEFEYEKELITKMLRKLVKVIHYRCYMLSYRLTLLCHRTTT
jgi:DNA replication licensing factor MCM6